jgi:hypothetical protein
MHYKFRQSGAHKNGSTYVAIIWLDPSTAKMDGFKNSNCKILPMTHFGNDRLSHTLKSVH